MNDYRPNAPAQAIRLLHLLPRTSSGMLSGKLKKVSIDATPTFVSISHVWGSNLAEARMQVDSGSGNKFVPISRNLESLLQSLLSHSSDTLPQLWQSELLLPMWIDMVCIDQADEGDKSSQIPLMRRIYSQSKIVLIWINESDGHLRYAFQYLRHIAKSRSCTGKDELWTLFDPMGWDALIRLLGCDWFHRRWVIQEAVLSKEAIFLCGPDVMPMEDLFNTVNLVTSALVSRPSVAKALKAANVGSIRPILVLKQLKQTLHRDQGQQRLLWLLENLRTTRATVMHDQVYGLLGLCSPEEAASNPIRYDLGPQEIFRTCVEQHARLYNNLDFLGLCTPAQRNNTSPETPCTWHRSSKWPSWVPNWGSTRLRRCLGPHGVDQEGNFNASGSMVINYSFKGDELVVSGILIDKIRDLGDFCDSSRRAELSDPNSMLFQQFFEFWMNSANGSITTVYGDRESQADAFARTMSLLGIYLNPVPAANMVPTMFYKWCKDSKLGRQLQQFVCGSRIPFEAPYERSFIRMKRLLSWQPFVTEKGYFGLAREQCMVGDEIWLIAGCNVPITLSCPSKKQGGSTMEVKGECFLDGFMFGEIWAGSTRNAPKPQVVTLV
ncbi:heterokaryon incompatibility protein (HET) domain-containing protein [Pochonia chlamydosporia 170]|uniref:Heterokaryon incompatibility protein (HET) domain-containing protein n=1 Tax=Pochonia chlamydosporia 170 TaxID=1380566 RepID=A0A179F8U3_METCM|nr:heterokaryon incompatibility protein (HET) domain-containing protein [Pochonia chlamydosporia 170]OAQ61519.2 heterokaryon incompatibility protein (HET) domain-containing protein [Pochonia chlamydosporia 170]